MVGRGEMLRYHVPIMNETLPLTSLLNIATNIASVAKPLMWDFHRQGHRKSDHHHRCHDPNIPSYPSTRKFAEVE